jgi:hypothetical protein
MTAQLTVPEVLLVHRVPVHDSIRAGPADALHVPRQLQLAVETRERETHCHLLRQNEAAGARPGGD